MVTFNVDSLNFVDDEEARFGADTDFATRFDSANTRLELEDLTNATVGYVPQDVGTDLVGGKFAETVSDGKALSDDGNVYDTVQSAVNSASSWVKIGPGRFSENVDIQTEGLTIVGSGDDTVVGNVRNVAFRISGVGNVTIRDLTTIVSSGGGITGDSTMGDAFFENITFDAEGKSQYQSIEFLDDNDNTVVVNDCLLINKARGISAGRGPRAIIVNNTIEAGAAGIGIYLDDKNHVVANNTIIAPQDRGINVNCNDSIIIGNIVKDSAEKGINISGNDNIIANNRIINSTDTDIDDSGGTGTVLDANLTT